MEKSWRKYTLEFMSIFVAVISAFALNNWNDNRREARAEEKILVEIKNGLKKDVEDLATNIQGHKDGIRSCQFWRDIIKDKSISQDTIQLKYIQLTRDFTSLQNISGYETLKSRGLEIIDNDSLRSELISLYEYDYYTLRKLEEDYEEMQFQKSYFQQINALLAPNFIYDEKGNLMRVQSPINLSQSNKNLLLSYLLKIELNRNIILGFYARVEENVAKLEEKIERELNR